MQKQKAPNRPQFGKEGCPELIPKECFKSIPPAFDAVYGPLRGHFGGGSEAGVLRAGGPAGHGRPGRPNFSQKFRRFSIREIGISSLSLSLTDLCYLLSNIPSI
jgi:hypothetical protein